MISVEITGMQNMLKISKKLGDVKQYNRFLEDVVNDTADLMRNMCPVDTGRLEESIKVVRLGNNKFAIVVDVPYAIYMEYGTRYFPVGKPDSPRVRESKSGKMSYHPFMRTAIWIMDKEYNQMFKRILYYIH